MERKLYHERTEGRYLKNIESNTLIETDDVEVIGSTFRNQMILLLKYDKNIQDKALAIFKLDNINTRASNKFLLHI